MVDYYLDETDWGDFFDPENGYDFKLKRTGSGQYDTEYTLTPCKPTELPKKYRNMEIDLEEIAKAIVPSYEETETMLADYLTTISDDDEEEKPRSRRNRDDDDDKTPSKDKRRRNRDLE
jgi:hypothetical protein